MPKLNKITDFVDTHPIGKIFRLGKKMAVWKRVTGLTDGMKIAVEKNGKLDWDEIVSIKKVGRERVWDIEVEGTHNFVGNGILAHNTQISLTNTGDLNISLDNSGNYQLTDTSNNSVINRIGTFGQLVAASIKVGAITVKEGFIEGGFKVADTIIAGAVETKDLAANSFTAFQGTIDNLLINSGLVAGNIQTKLISPLADETDVTVKLGSEATPSGKLSIQNTSNKEVASVDSKGNATFSGEVHADKIFANQIVGGVISQATDSAELKKIYDILAQVKTDQDVLLAATASADINATGSATLALVLTGVDLYVTNQATINALSVTNAITVGTDLVFGSENHKNTINTLTSPLKIQSLAIAPIEMMDGRIIIDTNGNTTINANLAVNGSISGQDLSLKANPENKFGKIIEISNNQGVIVASIDASGSAIFSNIQTQKITGSDQDRGSVDILPAEDTKTIEKNWDSTPSAVFVSSSYQTQSWIEKLTDKGFSIRVGSSPQEGTQKLFWWTIW